MKKKVSLILLIVMIASLVIGLVACDDKEVLISFDTGSGDKINDLAFNKGEAPTLEDVVASRSGYKFVGWYFDKEFTKPYDKDKAPKKGFTLYAKYEKLANLYIDFEMNGGLPVSRQNYVENTVPSFARLKFVKYDYDLEGFYLDEALTIKYEQEPITSNLKLYAKWVDSEYASIIFETNGGDKLKDFKFKKTEKPILENNDDVIPYKNGYRFYGWYFDEELTRPYVPEEAPNKSFKLYARYELAKSTTDFINSVKNSLIAYDLNKGFSVDLDSIIAFDFENNDKDQYNWAYELKVTGNIFNADPNGNNNISIEILNKLNNNATILALKNHGTDLYIETDLQTYKISGVNMQTLLFKALMVNHLPEGSNLGNITIYEKITVNDALGYIDLALSLLSSELNFSYNGEAYVMNFEVAEVIEYIADLLEGFNIKLPPEVNDFINTLKAQKVAIEMELPESKDNIIEGVTFNIINKNNDPILENGKLDTKTKLLVDSINKEYKPVINGEPIDVNLLKHSMQTSFELKDSNGQSIGKYAFDFKMDFDQTTLIDSLIDSIQTKSPYPVLEDVFKQKNGKIYMNLSHVCDETCKLGHYTNKKNKTFNGSVLSIAYDPSVDAFNNNKIYVAVNLKSFLSTPLLKALVGGLEGLVATIVAPDDMEYLAISIDVENLAKVDKLAALPSVSSGQTPEPSPQEPIDGEFIKNLINIFYNVLGGVQANQDGWNINVATIWDAIKPIIPQDKLELATGIFEGLLPNVANIEGTPFVYTNAGNFEDTFNGKEEFLYKNDAHELKVFTAGKTLQGDPVTQLVGANPTVLEENGLPKIYTKYPLKTQDNKLVLSVEELRAIKAEIPKIDIQYTDTNGQVIQSKGIVYDIRGLDPSKIDVPQTITLVIGRGAGDNLWDVLGKVGDLLKDPTLMTLALPQTLYEMEIILSNIVETKWEQDKSATNPFNPETIYKDGDKFNTVMMITTVYSNGSTKEHKNIYTTSNKLNDIDVVDGSSIKYYSDFDIEYSYIEQIHKETIKVKEYTLTVAQSYSVNKGKNLVKSVKHPEIAKAIALSQDNDDLAKQLQKFADDSNGKIELVRKTEILGYYKFTFKEAGSYTANIIVNGVKITIQFTVQ